MSDREHSYHPQPGNRSSDTGRLRPTNPFREFRKDDVEQSVPARFEQIAREHSDRVALKDEHRSYTYRELNEHSNCIAHTVLEQGITPQTPVAVMVEQGFLHIAAILGVLKAGGVFVALDPANPASRIQHMLVDSGAQLIVADRRSRPMAEGLTEERPRASIAVEKISPSLPRTNPNLPIGPDEVGCLLYTSGSSGIPKGSVVTHRYLLRHVLKATNGMHISHLDRLSLLSSAGVSAAIGTTLVALMNGACLLPFSVQAHGLQALADWLLREEITVYHSVPTLFRHWAQNLPENTLFPGLRLIWLSGEAVLRREVDLFKSRFAGNVLLCNSLGSTEGGAIAEYYLSRETPFDDAVLPVGYEADDMQVMVVDEGGNEVAPGQIGEITVRIRSRGYWRRPDLSETTFLPDSEGGDRRIYRTGDLGYMLPDRCLVHLGRRDSQVKVRGHRIELAEVEMALMDLPGVREAVVAAKKDALEDTRLVAYIVPEGEAVLSVSALRRHLQQRLPDFMIPAGFVTLDALPLGPSGKVDRLRLPDPPAVHGTEAEAEPEAEREMATQVAQLWKRLLGLRQVGPDDNFFDLGGDSLLAITMALEIENQFKVRLPIDVLFDLPTPARLAAAISTGSHADLGACLVPIQPRGSRPPLYCVHGIGGFAAYYRVLAGQLGPDQPVYGLRPRSVAGNHPISYSVEEMASHYVEDILAFQPNGPYFLAGHSRGGIFAYEVARQLRRKGCAVGLLALLDSACPFNTKPYPLLRRAPGHLAVVANLTPRQRLDYLRNGISHKKTIIEARGLRLLLGLLRRAVGHVLPGTWTLGTLDHAILIALSTYHPHPYPGRLVLFAATEDSFSPFYRENPLWGWKALASEGVEVRHIPGSHLGIMQEPQVATLARELGECIQSALEGHPGPSRPVAATR